MDQSALRQVLLVEKDFVRELYCASPNHLRYKLSVASNQQLDLIVRLVGEVAAGRIPITRREYDAVKRKRKATQAHVRFGSAEVVQRLLSEPPQERELRLGALFSVSAALPNLLHPIVSTWAEGSTSPQEGDFSGSARCQQKDPDNTTYVPVPAVSEPKRSLKPPEVGFKAESDGDHSSPGLASTS